MERLKGLIPAVFTPMLPDHSLDLKTIKPLSDLLIADGVCAFYVCGSTGEGPLMTTPERKRTVDSFIEAVDSRIPVIVQVGHQSIRDSCELAAHAAASGADAFSAVPPNYFRIPLLDVLIDCIAEIASAAPSLPFYYYHIPQLSGVDFDMVEFLRRGSTKIPNLRGIKYSNYTVFELQACMELENGRFELFFGSDEMLLSALAAGVKAAVGSTYNFAAPLYNRIIRAFDNNNLEEARRFQARSVEMARTLYQYRGQAAFKAAMKLVGVDCGPNRLPHKTLSDEEFSAMRRDLERIGFVEWAR